MEKLQYNKKSYDELDCFNRLVDEANDEILSLLDNPESMPRYMIESQLRSILGELNTMRVTMGQSNFYPYYPKGIADCWLPDEPLAIKLKEILNLYNKLKRI